MHCPKCNKYVPPAETRCGSCGWTKSPTRNDSRGTELVRQETFRSSNTLLPFISSGLILGFLAFMTAMVEINDRYHSTIPWIFVAFFVVFGPMVSTVQIIRRFRVWVRVEPGFGLVFGSGKRVSWADIADVEQYSGIFSYADRIGRPMSGRAVVAAIKLGCLSVPALILWYVFLPVFSVLSPWHARVTVYLQSGEKVILRDLERSHEFYRMVRFKLQSPMEKQKGG